MQHILDYLFDIALKNGIAIVQTKDLASETPSLSLNARRAIIVNMNWYNRNEIPFIVAHELSHMVNNDSFILYKSTATSKIEIEGVANKNAISMLISYLKIEGIDDMNPVQFMEQFGIPCKYESVVANQLARAHAS